LKELEQEDFLIKINVQYNYFYFYIIYMNNFKIILKQYRDRCYINSILCEASYNFYNFINNIFIFPTILGSSILTCLNSSNIDSDKIKITNIIINGTITITLAMTTQYKLHDRIGFFKSYQIKYTKLNHQIESILNTKKDEDINIDDINMTVSKYDLLCEELQFIYPEHLKNRVIKRFKNTEITLPNSLALQADITISVI
jgi:hypothetical protein